MVRSVMARIYTRERRKRQRKGAPIVLCWRRATHCHFCLMCMNELRSHGLPQDEVIDLLKDPFFRSERNILREEKIELISLLKKAKAIESTMRMDQNPILSRSWKWPLINKDFHRSPSNWISHKPSACRYLATASTYIDRVFLIWCIQLSSTIKD